MALTPIQQPILQFNPLDPIGSILDGALNKIENAMTDTVNAAHDAALDVIIQSATQIAGLITSLKQAYLDEPILIKI